MKWLSLLLLFAAPSASAEVTPHPGGGDPHIQQVNYDPEQVVLLRAAPGYAVTVELSPDERIENIAIGNSASWQVQPNRRGDNLFIKTLDGTMATNMTVITDVRRYNFLLAPGSASDLTLPYAVRFIYPAPSSVADEAIEPMITRFKLHGDKSLWPTAMSDNGQVTSMIWPDDQTMPAVYSIDRRGKASLVNGLVEEGAYVIHGVSQRFVFKLGNKSASATSITPKKRRQ